ncbi:MAG: hypothetical protein H7175_22070 [Burkholderiales bacterium]|nr:hypothetical protein [Anaerolineae bacterium]
MAIGEIRELLAAGDKKVAAIEADAAHALTFVLDDGAPLHASPSEKLFHAVDTNGKTQTGILAKLHTDGSVVWYGLQRDSHHWGEIDPEQLWFWTDEWQAGERQVDEDLKAGRYEVFDNLDDFFDTM